MNEEEIALLKAENARLNRIIAILLEQNEILKLSIASVSTDNAPKEINIVSANADGYYKKIKIVSTNIDGYHKEKDIVSTNIDGYYKEKIIVSTNVDDYQKEINKVPANLDNLQKKNVSEPMQLGNRPENFMQGNSETDGKGKEKHEPLPVSIPYTVESIRKIYKVLKVEGYNKVRQQSIVNVAKLLIHFHNGGGGGYTELSKITGQASNTLNKFLGTLKQRNYIKRTGWRKFELTANGYSVLRRAGVMVGQS